MEFYKKRSFGDLVGDTFSFFKQYGKNYFKTYLTLNGIPLIILLALIFILFTELISPIMNGNLDGNSTYFEQYFQENKLEMIGLALIFFFITIALLVINYTFPVYYLKRVSSHKQNQVKTDEILSDITTNKGRIFKLFLGLIFIVMPLSILIIGVSYALIFVLIGIFLMFFVTPIVMNITDFVLFDYLNTKRSFFDSLSYSISAQFSYKEINQKSPLMKYWGGTTVMYLIMQIIVYVFTFIPMIFFMLSAFSTDNFNNSSANENGAFAIIMFVFYLLAILASIIMSNLIYVCQGLMYYDSRTDLHRNKDFEKIDNLGVDAA